MDITGQGLIFKYSYCFLFDISPGLHITESMANWGTFAKLWLPCFIMMMLEIISLDLINLLTGI